MIFGTLTCRISGLFTLRIPKFYPPEIRGLFFRILKNAPCSPESLKLPSSESFIFPNLFLSLGTFFSQILRIFTSRIYNQLGKWKLVSTMLN